MPSKNNDNAQPQSKELICQQKCVKLFEKHEYECVLNGWQIVHQKKAFEYTHKALFWLDFSKILIAHIA